MILFSSYLTGKAPVDLIFERSLQSKSFSQITNKLQDLLFKSIERRVKTQPNLCKDCIKTELACVHAKTGILFSGGLDSAIIALIANSCVDKEEPIDLYNVSFQRTSLHQFNNVPDRINGQNTLEELKTLCPNRKWNFVEV